MTSLGCAGWARATARIVVGLLSAAALFVLVVGLPWALCRYVGWPLPDHVPSLAELRAELLAPLSPSTLLDILACACWLTWAIFVVDVACCAFVAAQGVRGRQLRIGGPVRRAAGGLVAAVLLAVVGGRAAIASTAAATHPAMHTATTMSATAAPIAGPGTVTVTEIVRPPSNGVHDSLWHVAERVWGDGTRWPELFEQNRGVIQPDGRALIAPDHVRPGWRLTAQVPAPPAADPGPPPTPEEPEPPPATPRPTQPDLTTPSEPATERSGIDLATGGFISLALAAAIGTAVTTLRLRRRRRYRVGSGHRADLHQPLGPVVRALLIPIPPSPSVNPSSVETPLGEREGRQHAVDLAATSGLGLTGPGALLAARALLLHLLAIPRPDGTATVLVPKPDLGTLLPDRPTTLTPPNLVLTDTIDTAIDWLEAALTTRTRTGVRNGLLVLLARPTQETEERLRAVLDGGSEHGMAVVLLGPWQCGTTLRIDANGTVEASSSTPDIVGTKLYSLPDIDTAELLDLLARVAKPADEELPSRQVSTGGGAQGTNEEKPSPALTQATPLDLYVLGRIRLLYNGADITESMTPKQREVLVHLALHPDGVRRDTIVADIWPNAPGPRPQNSFHAILSQLRRALRTATTNAVENITISKDGHYALDPAIVDVDLWRLQRTLHAAPDPATLTAITDLYRGELAEELGVEWLLAPRETVRRDVLDGLNITTKDYNISPEARLEILEHMRCLDPYNEGIYQAIIRAQRLLGRDEAIPRTIALLAAHLAEIGESPGRETTSLLRVS
jgi:DNA-binding SARP family transcriptional activator